MKKTKLELISDELAEGKFDFTYWDIKVGEVKLHRGDIYREFAIEVVKDIKLDVSMDFDNHHFILHAKDKHQSGPIAAGYTPVEAIHEFLAMLMDRILESGERYSWLTEYFKPMDQDAVDADMQEREKLLDARMFFFLLHSECDASIDNRYKREQLLERIKEYIDIEKLLEEFNFRRMTNN